MFSSPTSQNFSHTLRPGETRVFGPFIRVFRSQLFINPRSSTSRVQYKLLGEDAVISPFVNPLTRTSIFDETYSTPIDCYQIEVTNLSSSSRVSIDLLTTFPRFEDGITSFSTGFTEANSLAKVLEDTSNQTNNIFPKSHIDKTSDFRTFVRSITRFLSNLFYFASPISRNESISQTDISDPNFRRSWGIIGRERGTIREVNSRKGRNIKGNFVSPIWNPNKQSLFLDKLVARTYTHEDSQDCFPDIFNNVPTPNPQVNKRILVFRINNTRPYIVTVPAFTEKTTRGGIFRVTVDKSSGIRSSFVGVQPFDSNGAAFPRFLCFAPIDFVHSSENLHANQLRVFKPEAGDEDKITYFIVNGTRNVNAQSFSNPLSSTIYENTHFPQAFLSKSPYFDIQRFIPNGITLDEYNLYLQNQWMPLGTFSRLEDLDEELSVRNLLLEDECFLLQESGDKIRF